MVVAVDIKEEVKADKKSKNCNKNKTEELILV